ncbi:MAG: diphosphomevalonate decarboxylase [Candidatus Marsarchaeota archaeon]|jgi:diphosphomevalonate decarboxylase|nr:diphosphomevalonate decarboxylase [Candidatus Marsarchaeota archaeon]
MTAMKATAIANANTAIVKYWGKKDESISIPMNSSISLTIDSHNAKVTIEFSEEYKKDTAILNGGPVPEETMKRLVGHIDSIRSIAGVDLKAHGEARTNFPVGVGLASSSAGFAALTLAACTALGLKLSKRELSIISRKGSGSSCRSIYGGFVEWKAGTTDENSYAVQLADQNWWDIRDITVLVSTDQRRVDTRGGMKIATATSPYYAAWLKQTKRDVKTVVNAIKDRDFALFGQTAERNALMMHGTALTSTPELIYWVPETLKVMHEVMLMRDEGIACYFSCDTGANVHILSLPEDEGLIVERLKSLNVAKDISTGKPGGGVEKTNAHLF